MKEHYLGWKGLWTKDSQNMQRKKEEKGNASYEAYALVGFPYAFQIWAYEVIHCLE